MVLTQLDTELRRVARDRITKEQLPRTVPARVWGGMGSGLPCALCGQPINPDDCELHFEAKCNGGEPRRFHFHVACEALWKRECGAEQP